MCSSPHPADLNTASNEPNPPPEDETQNHEFVLYLANGNTIRTNTYDSNARGCDYVRVCDPSGDEIGYWSHGEWGAEPELVMGAILGAAGSVPETIRDSTSKV